MPEDKTKRFHVSTEPGMIQFDRVCAFIQNSYWGQDRKAEDIRVALENSLCFSAYFENEQVGFARVLTDRRYFAYLCDVIVFDEFQGRGFGKLLMKEVMNHKDLKSVRWAMLSTRDAHGLYEQSGFRLLQETEKFMELVQQP